MSLLARIAGVAAASALFGLAVAAIVTISDSEPPPKAPPHRASAFALLPAVNQQAASTILSTSPFAQDRSAFDRATASTPAPPPMDIRLTGIFRVGKELRASLNIGGQSVIVRQGDDTPSGNVERITTTTLILKGPPRKELEIFP